MISTDRQLDAATTKGSKIGIGDHQLGSAGFAEVLAGAEDVAVWRTCENGEAVVGRRIGDPGLS